MYSVFYDHCVKMSGYPNVVAARSRSFGESCDIVANLIKFIRGASGPHSQPHTKLTDNALAEKAIQIFGATPPVPDQKWPTAAGDDVVAYKKFLEELAAKKLRRYFH